MDNDWQVHIVLPFILLYFWFSRKYLGTVWSSWIMSFTSVAVPCPNKHHPLYLGKHKESVCHLLLLWFFRAHFVHFIRQLLQISINFIWTAGAATLGSDPCFCCFYSLPLLGDPKASGEGANKYLGGICKPDSTSVSVLPPSPTATTVFCDVFRVLHKGFFSCGF